MRELYIIYRGQAKDQGNWTKSFFLPLTAMQPPGRNEMAVYVWCVKVMARLHVNLPGVVSTVLCY